jgi:SET domain-containing protein
MSIMKNSLYVKETTAKGKGLFTKTSFKKNDIIIEFEGDIIDRADIPFPYPDTPEVNNLKQISKDKFLSMSGDMDDFINHSCNPNCKFTIRGSRAFLEALYDISKDTELTFDYSITSTDTHADWSMSCSCGSYTCRKIISGYDTLSEEKKTEYLTLGVVPNYVK